MQFLRFLAIVIVLWSFVVLLLYLTKGDTAGAQEVFAFFLILMGVLAAILAVFGINYFRKTWLPKIKEARKAKIAKAVSDTTTENETEQVEDNDKNGSNGTLDEQDTKDTPELSEETSNNGEHQAGNSPVNVMLTPIIMPSDINSLRDVFFPETELNKKESEDEKPDEDQKAPDITEPKKRKLRDIAKSYVESPHYKRHQDTPTSLEWFLGLLYAIAVILGVFLFCLILLAYKLY